MNCGREIMRQMRITNGTVILKDAFLRNGSVSIEGAKIASVGRSSKAEEDPITIDAKGAFVAPGFIDTHIHGSPKDIFSNETKYGTTSIVIALSCDRLDRICKRIERIKRFREKNPLGPNLLGVRLEGPYINKKKAGAQNKAFIKDPDVRGLSGILSKIGPILKIMTMAPELKGASALVRLLRKSSIVASIGHSDATYEEALKGIDDGITHATHVFNCMSGTDGRHPGALCAILSEKRVVTEVILDLIHVHEALFGLILKFKKRDKIILVTDSVTADPGRARLKGGVYRFKDGRIAGSALTMIGALKNAFKYCGVPLADAVRFMTLNPARLLGIEREKGSIAPGKDADLVVFDKNFDVKMTVARGRIVYRQ